jgi:predicted membrane-bound spermidine synthase
VTLTAVRLLMSAAVLIVPAALMGATLPLVVKSSLLDVTGLGGRVGVLYATNTAGAIAGSLCAGLILHPDARDALVIGLGGGATSGALSRHTGVTVDIVEISNEVVQAAARFFRPINFDVLRKPNVRMHVDDGRNYLLLAGRKYDVITADIILPSTSPGRKSCGNTPGPVRSSPTIARSWNTSCRCRATGTRISVA